MQCEVLTFIGGFHTEIPFLQLYWLIELLSVNLIILAPFVTNQLTIVLCTSVSALSILSTDPYI